MNHYIKILSFLVGTTAFLPPLYSENETEEEPFELSPFVVSAEETVGYVASETTLGGRTRQQIKDIPAQVEMITPEMIADFGITSAEDSFRYSLNVENPEEFISPNDGGSAALWEGREIGRIRGIEPTTFSTSRNLFSSITQTDVYNISHISIASGAQSLLFSLGEPAGMVNVQLNTAQMTDFGKTSIEVDSNDGYRFVLDVNKELLDDKFAVRLAAVKENHPNFLDPTYDRDTRYYGTLTARPLKGTEIRFHFEDVESVSNLGMTHLPWDWATPFFEAKENGTLDTLEGSSFGSIRDSLTYIYGGASEVPLNPLHWKTLLIPVSPGTLPVDPERFGSALDPNTGTERVTFNPQNIKLIPEVASSLGKNFFGNNVRNSNESRIYNLFIEQKIFSDLILELAGHWEKWNWRNESLQQYTQYGYKVDMNEFIPSTIWNYGPIVQPGPNTADFVPNPNYGKVYSSSIPSGNLRLEETEELRASLVYEPGFINDMQWMGDHSFLFSYTERESWEKSQQLYVRVTNPIEYFQPPFDGPMYNPLRLPILMHYYDNDNRTIGLPFGGTYSFDELFNGFQITEPTSGAVLNYAGWGDPTGGGTPDGSITEIDSLIASWQGKFWRERIILSYGVRQDDLRVRTVDRSLSGENFLAEGGWKWIWDMDWDEGSELNQSETSHTYGAIIRPLPWLSLSYYESSTFNLPSGRLTPFGDSIPGTNGTSRDYSVRVDTADGNFFLKLNRYEVTQRDNDIGFGLVRINALRMESAYMGIVDDRAEVVPGEPDYESLVLEQGLTGSSANGFTPLNDGTYPIIGDISSEGYEFTMGGFKYGVDFRLTFAKNETLNTNASSDWKRWIDRRLPFWSNLLDELGRGWEATPYIGSGAEDFNILLPDGSTRTMTMKEFYEIVVTGTLAVTDQQNDKPVDAGRKYRANLMLSYLFRDGPLVGFRFGGAARWRSAASIGFPLIELPNPEGDTPLPGLDLSNPYKNDEIFDLDLHASYEGQNFLGTGFSYRIQFNVRNLLTGENSFRSLRSNAHGESVFTLMETPREYSLLLEINF